MHTFLPAALSIDVEDGTPETATLALGGTSPANVYAARVTFHEAVHYWQQLGQGFLIRLAEEDWKRLIEYERSGDCPTPGPMRQEFYREDPDLGFSARDIHECLARFWEVIAFSPNRIMNDQWRSGRSSFHPDFVTANRPSNFQQRFNSQLPWGSTDLVQAMTMIGGSYAVPFLATVHTMGDVASGLVFPWIAHYALQTSRPATLFLRFIDSVASELAAIAREMVARTAGDPADTMVNMAIPALLRCLPIAAAEDEQLPTALTTYASSCGPTSPPLAWTFEHRIVPVVNALTESETVLAAARRFGTETTGGLAVHAIQLLEGALASPGVIDSRSLLLLAGLAPPCVLSPNGDSFSIPQQLRPDAREAEDTLRSADPFNQLLPFALDPARDREDAYLLGLCVETRRRWKSFVAAPTARSLYATDELI